MNAWRESVEEHREAIESWADSDLPLADEMQVLLEKAEMEAIE